MKDVCTYVAGAVAVIAVALLEPSALTSLLISAIAVVLVARWIGLAEYVRIGILSVTIAQMASLVLYASQYLLMPEYFGFSGREGGIGTDDHYFYSTAAVTLYEEFLLRPDYFLSTYLFSEVLRMVAECFHQFFGYNHPLQLLVLNNTGGALIPVFVYSLLDRLSVPNKYKAIGFLLAAFGPYLIANNGILLREGWVAAATVGTLVSALTRRWALMLLLLVVAYVMRPESSLLLVANLVLLGLMYWLSEENEGHSVVRPSFGRFSALLGLACIATLGAILYLPVLVDVVGKAVFGRPEFVQGFIRQLSAQEGGTSTLLAIYSQPWPIKIVGGFLFFLGAPFLAVNLIVVDGIFVPRALLQNLASLVFVCTLPFFVRAVAIAVFERRTECLATVLIFFLGVIALSLLSLQVRHKTMIMPIYYSLVAFGLSRSGDAALRLGVFAAVVVLCLNLIVTAKNML